MRKIGASISLIAIVVFAIGFGVSKYNSTKANPQVYTMQEALSDDLFAADFNVEEKSLAIKKENPLGEPTRIAISEKDEQELINAMEHWELTEYDYNSAAKNVSARTVYFLYLTINTGYSLRVELEEKSLYVDADGLVARYDIQNGDEFFTLFENALQKTPAGQ